MVRYYGLYANAHRGRVRKVNSAPVAEGMIEEELPPVGILVIDPCPRPGKS